MSVGTCGHEADGSGDDSTEPRSEMVTPVRGQQARVESDWVRAQEPRGEGVARIVDRGADAQREGLDAEGLDWTYVHDVGTAGAGVG